MPRRSSLVVPARPIVLTTPEVLRALKFKTGKILRPFHHPPMELAEEPGHWTMLEPGRRRTWSTNRRLIETFSRETGKLLDSREYLLSFDEWMDERRPFKPNEVLWVRESWSCRAVSASTSSFRARIIYRADRSKIHKRISSEFLSPWMGREAGWRSRRQMPRWATRIFLRVISCDYQRPDDPDGRWQWVVRYRVLPSLSKE
jgi:hypothetical protein